MLKELQAVYFERGINLYLLFIDFKKAYDTINRKELLTTMQELEIPNKMIRLTGMTIENTRNRIMSNGILSQPFQVTIGLRQGDPMLTTLFNLALEVIIRRSGIHRSGTIYDKRHQNLAFIDDLTFVTRTESE